jgi:hypothetical protein
MDSTSAFPTVDFFDGSVELHNLYYSLVKLANIWDDLVDKDHEVTEADINRAFEIALCDLPANPLYAALQQRFIPLWQIVIANYTVSNLYERAEDDYGLEISHVLRHEGGSIMVYAMIVVLGRRRAEELAAVLWKDIVDNRLIDYKKEHGHA